jgi:hypothetical protein
MSEVKKDAKANAAAKAIAIVAIRAIIQLTLLFYSVSHPWASSLVTASFLVTIVYYPVVSEYQAYKMKTSERRSSESFCRFKLTHHP